MTSKSTMTVGAVVAALIGSSNWAQAQGEGALVLEEITVTARKTEVAVCDSSRDKSWPRHAGSATLRLKH